MRTPYGYPGYGRGAYGGRDSVYSPVGATVLVYDRSGAAKGFFQLGIGKFFGIEFSVDENGCNMFTLHFSGYVEIERGYKVLVFLFDQADPFFSGVVRSVPVEGSTSLTYDYGGFGMNDYLVRLTTGNASYVGDTVAEIVEDLLDSVIVPNTTIVKNLLKIQAPDTVVTQINFKYAKLKEALEELQKIANADGNDYLFGVDNLSEFFFKPRAQEVVATLVVGAAGRYGIDAYEPVDGGEPRTLLHVLKDDGTYYADFASADGTLDVYEEKLTAPPIDDADLDNWALGQLAVLERYERQATVQWRIWTQQPLVLLADGQVRVLCHRPPTDPGERDMRIWYEGLWGSGLWGGELYQGYTLDDTLDVKSVQYTVNDRAAMREVELGARRPNLLEDVIRIQKDVTALRVSSGR